MTNAEAITDQPHSAPPHVPQELVIDTDFYSDSGYDTAPFAVVAGQPTGPRIFYTPRHYMLPGSWVITRAEDARHVLQNPELFSSTDQVIFSQLIGETWNVIPLELDPPDHMKFRTLLNPIFSPKEINKLEAGVRQAASGLIDNFAEAKEVEFVGAFTQPFPVSVFLQLLGLPLDQMPQFLKWEHMLLKSFNLDHRKEAARGIITYLRQKIAERRGGDGSDLITFAANATIEGRAVTDDEVIGICFLLYIAGLDTVASSLGFYFHFLATHPEVQAQLRANRELVPAAIEELLRLYSIVIAHRRVAQDTEVAGVRMKKGDYVSIPTFNASRDPDEFDRPFDFVIDRQNKRHVAFSYGPHRCLGSHLARREFVVALNEMFDRLPPFRLKEGSTFKAVGGGVFGVEEMHLVFDR